MSSPPALTVASSAVSLKLGPYHSVGWLNWEQSSRLYAQLGFGEEFSIWRIHLPDGLVHRLPVEESLRVDRSDHRRRLSPDGSRAVLYGKIGPGSFINFDIGKQHELDAPGFVGSNMLDSWAPTGRWYLLQSPRQDEVPGFYLMDRDGQPAGSWAEPGYYSHRAVWAPDGERIAFLSTPLEVTYPHAPDGWDEQPFGARLGVLHVASMEHLPVDAPDGGQFYGFPLWSPDGAEIAIMCGQAETAKRGGYPVSVLREPRICLVDSQTGELSYMTEVMEYELNLKSWAPDGQSLVLSYWSETEGGTRDLLVRKGGGEPLRLRETWWLSKDRVIHWDGRELAVLDLQGQSHHVIYRGVEIIGLTVNPYTQMVAFLARENDQYYLYVRQTYPEG